MLVGLEIPRLQTGTTAAQSENSRFRRSRGQPTKNRGSKACLEMSSQSQAKLGWKEAFCGRSSPKTPTDSHSVRAITANIRISNHTFLLTFRHQYPTLFITLRLGCHCHHGQLVQQRANCLPRRRQWLGRFGRYQSSQTHATLRQATPHRHAATPYSLDQSCHRSSTPSAVSTIDRATCYELVARRCFAL